MLKTLARIIEQKPWLVIGLVLVITLLFASFLPSLEMQTSMDDFLPQDEVVQAQERINNLFGEPSEMIMIHVATQQANSVLSPDALREQYSLSQLFDEFPETLGTISVVGFVDTLCWLEFNQSLLNCTTEEIQTALYDLLIPQSSSLTLLDTDDPNEPIDYYPSSHLKRGKSIDYLDIKNYDITDSKDTLIIGFQVYDLPEDIFSVIPPIPSYTLLEWYIDFDNLISPVPALDIQYRIAAHIEPLAPLWEIGNHLPSNIRDLVFTIKNHSLFKSYKGEAYLWMQPSDKNISIPVPLQTAQVSFFSDSNRVEIQVSKKELGTYGIAPTIQDFGLPARLGHITAGVRLYNTPLLNLPWLRVTLNASILNSILDTLQNRSLLHTLLFRFLDTFTDFTQDDFDTLHTLFQTPELPIDTLSLKDIESLWKIIDTAPDQGYSDHTFFLEPSYLRDMRSNAAGFLSGNLSSFDQIQSTLMMVPVNGSLASTQLETISKTLVHTMKDFDNAHHQITVNATGNSIIEYEINEVSMDANTIVIPLIFLVISLILFITFRKPSYVLIPLLGLTIAIIWLFGTMVLLNLPFMVIEVALIPMLMGLGVDYSVHLFHNYRVEIEKGQPPQKAISLSIKEIGMPLLLATVTTFIAFLSFLTATMIPLRDFGILCAIGIAYTFIIAITFQSALRYIIDRFFKSEKRDISLKKNRGGLMKKTEQVVCRHPLVVLFITIGITIVMILGFFYIDTGFQTKDFLPQENPSVVVMNTIADEFPLASQEREYIFIEGNIATRQTLLDIHYTIENLKDDPYVLKTLNNTPKTVSILAIMEKAVENNGSLADTYSLDHSTIPQTDDQVQAFFTYLYESDLYGYETREVLHREGDYYDAVLITVYTTVFGDDSGDTNKAMEIVYEDLHADIANLFNHTHAMVTGENSMMFVIMESMTESQIISTGICIILAGLVLIFAYRNILLGLITLIPVSISTIWIIGTMYFIGYSLNVMTIMITSLTIGLGITYAIHAVERFRQTADKTGDVLKSVSETIGHTGTALFIAAITTIFGFGLLIFTPVPIEQQFGIITAITILYAFLTSIFVLPPVLLYWGKWRKKSKGYVIQQGPPNK